MSVSAQRKRAEPRCPSLIAAKRPTGSNVVLGGADAEVPEWMTDAWKHRVEAECRQRLSHKIHGIGANR